MLAKDLIDRLERLGLLDQEIIEALREQLQQSGARVTPEAVAKLLVDNGQLTTFQATKLIGELRNDQYAEPVPSDGLTDGLEDPFGDDFGNSEPAVEAMAVDAIPVDAIPVEAMPVDAAADGDSANGSNGSRPVNPNRPTRQRPVRDDSSPWDSFKIYGYAGIIVSLLLAGFALWFILSREDADANISRADDFYNQQNYQAAQDAYIGFLEDFGQENKHSSAARTKITMTELYKAAQFTQEPGQAVDVAKNKLPQVAEEPGMNDQRANLAGLLVSIAGNITDAADKSEDTQRKRELLAELEEHYEVMENPLYMPSNMRVTLAPQLEKIEEDRARVQRDINRNIRLDESENAMVAALKEQDTKRAYDVRSTLLQDFPELHDNSRLQQQIQTASGIQQELVESSTKMPKVEPGDNRIETVPTVVLTTLEGRTAPELRGETLYLRSGGSVMAFDGESGKLQWRRFIGYSKNLPPVRIDGDSGVLLSDSQKLEVIRCAGDSGDTVWRTNIDEEFLQPISQRQGVYVTANAGRLYLLDVETGDTKWATQYPQPLEAGPGVDRDKQKLYQAGNHSNLYVLSDRDGSCSESFYLGHNAGTVIVPPVALLGHVFVIENATADYSKVHVLRVDENGDNLRIAQPPFRLVGNVRVNPVVEGRQLIVLTDRGEVKVLDIEPTAERDQVTEAARLPPFYDSPTETQMAVGKSSMWIAGTRIGRYELQISSGRIIRKWSLNELDTFIGQPIVRDDVLVHSRILRGSSAIRVTAANPKTGEEIWRTDVGVPVAAIRRAPDGKSFHAITSQAALFNLDREAIQGGTTQSPLEDPGATSVGIRYTNPISIGDGEMVMVDISGGQKLLYYNPKRPNEKVREVTMQLPSGHPNGGALFSGGGIFLPLDSGRAVLVNHVTGAMLATPFQPISDPSAKISWSRPVALPDDAEQVVLADSRNQIYRLRVGPQIRELSKKDLEKPLLGPAAGVGMTYLATTSGAANDNLVGFDMGNLDKLFDQPMAGRVVWGPVSAGEKMALLITAEGILFGYDEKGKEVFQTPVGSDQPAGDPLLADNQIVLAMRGGELITLNDSSGEIISRNEIGQPISATPLSVGETLLVPGAEGVIYRTQ